MKLIELFTENELAQISMAKEAIQPFVSKTLVSDQTTIFVDKKTEDVIYRENLCCSNKECVAQEKENIIWELDYAKSHIKAIKQHITELDLDAIDRVEYCEHCGVALIQKLNYICYELDDIFSSFSWDISKCRLDWEIEDKLNIYAFCINVVFDSLKDCKDVDYLEDTKELIMTIVAFILEDRTQQVLQTIKENPNAYNYFIE